MKVVKMKWPKGEFYYLRSTIWTSDRSRADQFVTEESAQIQLEKAKKFMRNSKALKYIEIIDA